MKKNFFVVMPSFENYGGHEFTFLRTLKDFSSNNKLYLQYLLPASNKINLSEKSYKIFYISKRFNFILKFFGIFLNFYKIKNFFKEKLNDNDVIYLDGFSLYFLISFILFNLLEKKKFKLILWLRYSYKENFKDKFLKFFINKICISKNTIFLTENELLKNNLKKHFKKINLFTMPSLHNLSKFRKFKKFNKKNFTIICPGIYRDEKYGENLVNFLITNNQQNFKLRISKYFILNLKADKKYLKKNILTFEDNLDKKNFIKEIIKSDAVLLPYKIPDYSYRTSGIFFETISLNKFTFVSTGSLMSKDLKKFNLNDMCVENWKNLNIKKILSVINNRVSNKKLLKFSNYYKKINGSIPFSNKLKELCVNLKII